MKLIYLLALVVMTTVANVVSAGIPKCSIWHMMGRLPDETDSTRYYQCIFAIPRLTICPIIADKQTYFDPTLELCLWSEASSCNSTASPTPGTHTSPTPVTVTKPTPSSMTCKVKEEDIPDPPTKPTDCKIDPCNGPIKGTCTQFMKWTGNTSQRSDCLKNHYYNVRIQECDLTACPPCA